MDQQLVILLAIFGGSLFGFYTWKRNKNRDYLFLASAVLLLGLWNLLGYLNVIAPSLLYSGGSTFLLALVVFCVIRLLWRVSR